MADQEKDLRRREDELQRRVRMLDIRERQLAARERAYDSVLAKFNAVMRGRGHDR